jgi:hypothetical protein
MKKSGKLACHVENSNMATASLPTLQTLHGWLALIEKIYYSIKSRSLPTSQISGRMYNTAVSIKFTM